MDAFYEKLVQRNERETVPFLPIYGSYTSLLSLTESLQQQCQESERELAHLRQQLNDDAIVGGNSNNSALKSALKNETRLRDKLEKLQEEYNLKLKAESQLQSDALIAANKLETARDEKMKADKKIENLEKQIDQANQTIRRFEEQLEEAESAGKLSDQLAEGLKSTIRSLQEENAALLKENTMFSERMVSEKTKIVEQMNELTEMVDSLKKENDMLKEMKNQERDREKNVLAGFPEETSAGSPRRIVGDIGVVLPTEPKFKIPAHTKEGSSIRFDSSGSNRVVTAGADGVVKVWDSTSGAIRSTLYGSMGQVMTSCDIGATLVVGGGTDKTCRVWDQKTSRMIHQLVGHQHRVTCALLFGDEKFVLTGSADRSLMLWDISRRTYKVKSTMRHSATSSCLATTLDSKLAVSGHADGGLRFWDLATGNRTADIKDMHQGGITSVSFDPSDGRQLLTNCLDSALRIIDLRSGKATRTMSHDEFATFHGTSASCFSPDGRYVVAGSNSGSVFVWDARNGKSVSSLGGGHESPVIGVDWSVSGNGGPQVATMDRRGTMVLWA